MRERLVELGFPVGRKSSIAAPPSVTYDRPSFWRGVIDADGSLGFVARGVPYLSLCTKSEALAKDFKDLVREVSGAVSGTGRNKRDDAFNVLVYSEVAQAVVAYLYEDAAIALPRKRARAEEVLRWRRPDDMRARSMPRRWTDRDDAVVLSTSTSEAARLLGRTEASVAIRRRKLRQQSGEAPTETGRLRRWDTVLKQRATCLNTEDL